ncbi:hypothetical protein BN59_03297 [Legionella massiliensis]|uniref:Inositolphosphotransferase Aur1/Ipt1 domain-containing protein n=1 Tax=Legionella massiliensis TaxID=1034943 RepID=A0A078L181_9GAMM|nr:phosphatase PAP2 family protein [Legionella massiliensis]CDZ78982.1 hypothetical protein BN59_03297 [Legionella massiliensis]CEE14720.1 hypothetical protein BN1094_03297 [Legionella massiliensis]
MPDIKNFLKSHQIETYLLIFLPILWISITGVFEHSPFSILLGKKGNLLSWSFFFGGHLIKKGFAFFYLYLYFRVALWLSYLVRTKLFHEQAPPSFSLKSFLLSFCYFTIAIGLGDLLLVVTLKQLSLSSSQNEMIAASQFYMSLDRYIFGFDPQIWIQRFSDSQTLDFLLIQSYRRLPIFFAFVFFGLLFFNKQNFRKLLIAIFLSPLIALPFWYALPAVTPNEMYRQNMFDLPSITATQQEYKEAMTSSDLKAYLKLVERHIENPKQKHPLVSTNPSMHVCWGIIVTYFAILLWWPLAFIFVPWLIFNIFATLYTVQHYFVDLPPGLVCAIFVIFTTNYLLKLEKKYYVGNYAPLYFIDIIQEDTQRIKIWCQTRLQKIGVVRWIFIRGKTPSEFPQDPCS